MAQDIRQMITRCLDFWEKGQYTALISNKMAESQSSLARADHVYDKTEARAFSLKVPNENFRVEVRFVHSQVMSAVIYTGYANSETGQPLMDVLR